ncbi:hypothetical protein GUITHDRAFT_147254 [Guillardia theta CCMP2712]|uniref:PKD/REJ-like domain-containing protein n=1 Tax=Guillardia theta (strain CCMP2712) TaxID=905079 RepID=L1IET3_GUITC|nr:hypothetical protein GUITHDRAFT_147254 [Guillardia theta CCMP2712]EKX34419.1 hypothetical protein GUITHDRAFT_147254 [Guillardia theta CCMP2712]|eukprot:XP_005821399.1 hypothetical protein GUITHDRAFT_147254 [Guillardia theta CCMP2712]
METVCLKWYSRTEARAHISQNFSSSIAMRYETGNTFLYDWSRDQTDTLTGLYSSEFSSVCLFSLETAASGSAEINSGYVASIAITHAGTACMTPTITVSALSGVSVAAQAKVNVTYGGYGYTSAPSQVDSRREDEVLLRYLAAGQELVCEGIWSVGDGNHRRYARGRLLQLSLRGISSANFMEKLQLYPISSALCPTSSCYPIPLQSIVINYEHVLQFSLSSSLLTGMSHVEFSIYDSNGLWLQKVTAEVPHDSLSMKLLSAEFCQVCNANSVCASNGVCDDGAVSLQFSEYQGMRTLVAPAIATSTVTFTVMYHEAMQSNYELSFDVKVGQFYLNVIFWKQISSRSKISKAICSSTGSSMQLTFDQDATEYVPSTWFSCSKSLSFTPAAASTCLLTGNQSVFVNFSNAQPSLPGDGVQVLSSASLTAPNVVSKVEFSSRPIGGNYLPVILGPSTNDFCTSLRLLASVESRRISRFFWSCSNNQQLDQLLRQNQTDTIDLSLDELTFIGYQRQYNISVQVVDVFGVASEVAQHVVWQTLSSSISAVISGQAVYMMHEEIHLRAKLSPSSCLQQFDDVINTTPADIFNVTNRVDLQIPAFALQVGSYQVEMTAFLSNRPYLTGASSFRFEVRQSNAYMYVLGGSPVEASVDQWFRLNMMQINPQQAPSTATTFSWTLYLGINNILLDHEKIQEGMIIVNAIDRLSFQALLSNSTGVSYEWSIPMSQYTLSNLPVGSSSNLFAFIPSGGILLHISLTAVRGAVRGSAQMETTLMDVDVPPLPGSCSYCLNTTSSNINPLVDVLTVSCGNWTDEDPPLRYN